jgi:rubrerythrin
MTHELRLDDVDVDGAVRETAAEAMEALDGDTRSQFLRRAGLAGGAVVGGGAVLGALAPGALAKGGHFSTGDRPPTSKFGAGDIGILRYALTLEYLESSFYNQAVANQRKHAFLKDAREVAFLSTVHHDENQHVKALQKVLGSKSIPRPTFNFHGDNNDRSRFLAASYGFENVGVHAYSGQAFNIKDPHVLAAALSIVTVEARHASVVGLLRLHSEHGIAPDGAFDKPWGASKVLKVVTSLNYIQ